MSIQRSWPRRRWLTASAAAALLPLLGCSRANRLRPGEPGPRSGTECNDGAITPITSGYGADGPLEVERLSVAKAGLRDGPTIFTPRVADGRRFPVIFFSHGYGPNIWSVYEPFLRHMASRGAVVVFGVFPVGLATMKGRYEALWDGFEDATRQYGNRMDLTRVGFIGHSFGGGANPALAHQGIVGRGWGSRGAFMFELAPWYSYGITEAQMRQFPKHLLHAVHVYDQDTMNDHRMAFDLYRQIPAAQKWVFLVKSQAIGGCELKAEHMLPSRARSLVLKQYALFRPVDLLMQAAFDQPDPNALAAIRRPSPEGYQPLEVLSNPQATRAESAYKFGWTGRMNPRQPGNERIRAQFNELSSDSDLPGSDDDAPARR